MFIIYSSAADSTNYRLDCEQNDTIQDILDQLDNIRKITAKRFVMFKGDILCYHRTLKEYGITNGDVLHEIIPIIKCDQHDDNIDEIA